MKQTINEQFLAERFPELWRYLSSENVTDLDYNCGNLWVSTTDKITEKIEDASINEWVVVEYGGYNDFLEVVSFDKYDPDDADDNCRLYMVFDESSGTYKVDMIYHHPIIATSHSSNNVYYDYYRKMEETYCDAS